MAEQRRGDPIGTYTGGDFYPLDPDPSAIELPDIANGLANTCRYAGQCQFYYSVGTHSIYVSEELADRGLKPAEIDSKRDTSPRDLLLALDENIQPPSLTTDGARTVLRRVTTDASIDIDHSKHEYLAPHGGRRGMGEVLVRAFGYTDAARYLDNSEEMVRKRYSHIEAGELGDIAAEALDEVDG